MLFRLRDPVESKGHNLLWYRVTYETNKLYRQGIKELQDAGVEILWITMDWRRGLLQSFQDTPTQMCHFHFKAIIRRNIGKNPKIEVHQRIKEFVSCLWYITFELRNERFLLLKKQYESWLKEKNKKGEYKHRKARSCFRSIKNHSNHLFTYRLHPWMPHTTNAGEGYFSWVKTKKSLHRGMSTKRRKKFIDWYLRGPK